jgi:hypothetical protein
MCLEVADMLFGPSEPFGLPICLFARDIHGFDSCLDELRISKCFLQNKYFVEPYQQISPIYIVGYIPDPRTTADNAID